MEPRGGGAAGVLGTPSAHRMIRLVVLVTIAAASLGLTASASAQTGEAELVLFVDGPGTVTAQSGPTSPIVGGNPCTGVGIEDSSSGLDESASRCVFRYTPAPWSRSRLRCVRRRRDP